MKELQEEAVKIAAGKGHFLGRWMMHPTHGISRSYAYCNKCVLRVDINTEDVSITGPAVDNECKRVAM